MVNTSVAASVCANAADFVEGYNFADQLERNVNSSLVCTEKIVNTHKVSELVANEFTLK